MCTDLSYDGSSGFLSMISALFIRNVSVKGRQSAFATTPDNMEKGEANSSGTFLLSQMEVV